MASFRKRNGGDNWYYKFTNADGRQVELKGCPDRRATEEMARAAESTAAKIRSGVINPRDVAYAAHEKRALADHLADFRQSVEDKGSSAKHASVTANRADRVLTLAKCRRISDLSSSKVLAALATLRKPASVGGEGLSIETINHHVRAVKAFSRWLWRDNRAREHALAHLSTSNPESDRRRQRRALTHEEAARLIQATASGPDVMGMSGPDRAMAYMVALGTGFRSDEIRSLTPEAFNLDASPPTATVDAGYTKNGKEAVQPLPPALAERLRPWLPRRGEGCPVLPLPDRTAEMLRVDLKAAAIPYETPAGVMDFHALRGSYISHVVSSGASVKTAQTLARHSTPSLTIGIYAKASPDDISGAMNGLPNLTPTGTSVQRISDTFATYLPLPSGANEHIAAQGVTVDDISVDSQSSISASRNPLQTEALGIASHALTHADDECRRRGSNSHEGYPSEDFKSPGISTQTPLPAEGLRRISEPFATESLADNCQSDPELRELAERWPSLPPALRAGIMAMVRAAGVATQEEGERAASHPVGGSERGRGYVELTGDPDPAREPLDARSRSDRRTRRGDERG